MSDTMTQHMARSPSQYDPDSLPYRVVDVRTGAVLCRGSSVEALYPTSERGWAAREEWRDVDARWHRIGALRLEGAL